MVQEWHHKISVCAISLSWTSSLVLLPILLEELFFTNDYESGVLRGISLVTQMVGVGVLVALVIML